MLSVISMLSSPNDESPANVDAAKMWREDRAGAMHALGVAEGQLQLASVCATCLPADAPLMVQPSLAACRVHAFSSPVCGAEFKKRVARIVRRSQEML